MSTPATQDLLERRERLLGAGIATFYDDPVHIVRGEGVWLYDADGRRYLDLYNNVPCVGHAHPHVVEAMQRQSETLNVHSRYLHEGILDYAEHPDFGACGSPDHRCLRLQRHRSERDCGADGASSDRRPRPDLHAGGLPRQLD